MIYARDQAPPICKKCNHKKTWKERANRSGGGEWFCQKCKNKSENRQAKRDPEARRASEARHRKAHPETEAAKYHARRARKRNATSPLCPVTGETIRKRFALIDGCAYCGTDAKKTLDHVVALKPGGLHVPSNIVGACHSCNSSKCDRPVEAWFKAQPFFSEQRWQRIQAITGQGQLSLI